MAEVTVNTVVKESKTPAVIGVGVLLGFMAQKAVNKAIGYTGTNGLGLIGDDTATNLKKYISPALVTGLGVAINLGSKDELVKNLGAGMAISGPVNVGMQLLWNKNPLSGLEGFLGGLIDDDEDLDGYDDEDLDGYDDEDEDDKLNGIAENDIEEDGNENKPMAALPSGDIKLNVDQSEIKQMEGNVGDIIPTKAPGIRERFPEPIFNNTVGEDVNLL